MYWWNGTILVDVTSRIDESESASGRKKFIISNIIDYNEYFFEKDCIEGLRGDIITKWLDSWSMICLVWNYENVFGNGRRP
jgi:hypothetical protein